MVFKICEGISCSSFPVKELDVIFHKNDIPCKTNSILAILYRTSLVNLVGEVGTRHSHQILLELNNRLATNFFHWKHCGQQVNPCIINLKATKIPIIFSFFPNMRSSLPSFITGKRGKKKWVSSGIKTCSGRVCCHNAQGRMQKRTWNSEAVRSRNLTYCSHKPECIVTTNPDRSVFMIITWHFQFLLMDVSVLLKYGHE